MKDFHIKACTPNQFTRPVIGLLWDYKTPGPYSNKIKNVLEKERRAIVLKIHYLPNEIEPDLLKSACARVATIVREVIGGESLFALSMHHQTADQSQRAQGLHVIIEYKGIPKLIASEDGLEMYIQFHPEAYDIFTHSETSKSNRNFFSYLLKKAEEYRVTSTRTAV